jgi:hypothetical protein
MPIPAAAPKYDKKDLLPTNIAFSLEIGFANAKCSELLSSTGSHFEVLYHISNLGSRGGYFMNFDHERPA